MSDFQPKLGDRRTLNNFDLETLDMKVLPKARQWMTEYPEGSPMWEHAKQTREYWRDLV